MVEILLSQADIYNSLTLTINCYLLLLRLDTWSFAMLPKSMPGTSGAPGPPTSYERYFAVLVWSCMPFYSANGVFPAFKILNLFLHPDSFLLLALLLIICFSYYSSPPFDSSGAFVSARSLFHWTRSHVMEPEYLRKFLALGLAGVWTPNRQSGDKLAPVVLMFDIIKGNTEISNQHGTKV